MQPHLTTSATIEPAQEFDAQQSVSRRAWVASPQSASAGARNAGLDALRASLTLLVVMHHTAITYGAIGGWFYREVPTDRSLSSTLLVYFCTVNQAFFMGLFFLLAGYLMPGAVERHGTGRYAVDRFKRLGLPLLFFGWILGPMTIAMAQTSRSHGFADNLVKLLRDGTFENGPLWFAQALLIFTCAGMLWLKLTPRLRAQRPGERGAAPWPSNAVLLGAAIVTGAAALALRMFWPVGVNVWGLQLGYFASYVVLCSSSVALRRGTVGSSSCRQTGCASGGAWRSLRCRHCRSSISSAALCQGSANRYWATSMPFGNRSWLGG